MTSVYRSRAGRDTLRAWCSDRIDSWDVPHERSEIDTSSGPTHVLVVGEGPRTFLYLPGTNVNAATSLALAGELARSGRVLLPDLPGQPGLSAEQRPPSRGRVAAYGRWAGEVVAWARTTSSPRPLVLVGHSLGAAVALAAPPDGVDGLVLLDPGGLVRARVTPALLAVTLRWLVRPSPRSARALAALMTAPGHRATEPLVEWLALVARHTWPSAAPGPAPPESTARWSEVPRLTVVGGHDHFFPPTALAADMRTRFGDDVVVLEELGHFSIDEDPRRLAGLVVGFGMEVAPGD